MTITIRGNETRVVRTPSQRGFLRKALSRAVRVIAVSKSLKQLAVEQGIESDKVEVIGNGVDTEVFHPLSKAEIRQQLSIAADVPVLVSVGTLVERKGFHRVMACLPELKARFPGLVYLIVGGSGPEGDWSDQLHRQVKQLGLEDTVRFVGHLAPAELKTALSAADVFVLATANEGWANVFLEAMACGLPVVATDVGGNAEVVCDAKLGTIVPFGDQAALSEAIDESLCRNWDRQAIEHYARTNSWDQRVERLLTLFEQLAERAGVSRVSSGDVTER